MSGSLTVIGGVNSNALTGLVTVPVSVPGALLSPLQTAFTLLSDAVTTGAVALDNVNIVAGGTISTNGSLLPGLLELTNTNTVGAVSAGSVSGSYTVPTNYSGLIVQAPGDETISGNGSDSFFGVFGDQSSVNFTADGGGTIVAGGAGDYFGLTGANSLSSSWSVVGSTLGSDTLNSTADSLSAALFGVGNATGNALDTSSAASNVVGILAGNATIASGGSNDLIASFGGTAVISVAGSANVLIAGGADTVYAAPGSTAVKAFFSSSIAGGTLDFINSSSTAASVTGASSGFTGSPGSVTVFGGAGGGYYQGGNGGNNSLVGGTGSTTLIGSGVGNLLSVTAGGANALYAAHGGTSTLIAGAGTSNTNFQGGGTDSIKSSGTGLQAFFVGASGTETLTGTTSTVAGSSNRYLFLQDTTGSGTDVITNFKYGTDHIYINPLGYTGAGTGVSIAGFQPNLGAGGGTLISLNDGTQIKLLGTTLTAGQEAAATLNGGTYL